MAFEEAQSESSMDLDKKIAFSIIIGAFLTLVTSVIPNNTAIGTSTFGLPFPWLSYPLYPIGSQPTVIWAAFGIDVILLIVIAFLVINAYLFLKSR